VAYLQRSRAVKHGLSAGYFEIIVAVSICYRALSTTLIVSLRIRESRAQEISDTKSSYELGSSVAVNTFRTSAGMSPWLRDSSTADVRFSTFLMVAGIELAAKQWRTK
jgi:hypothetical protein